jgi:hypothetical protein
LDERDQANRVVGEDPRDEPRKSVRNHRGHGINLFFDVIRTGEE